MSYLLLIVLNHLFYTPLFMLQEPGQGLSLVDLILRASPIAKLVLLALLGMSIASWAIIIAKAKAMKRADRLSREFLQAFGRSQRWADLCSEVAMMAESPIKAVFMAAQDELKRQARLNPEAIQRTMQSAAIDEAERMEKSLGWLASTASASPFIGLFGTVVGIIIAFQGLSQATTASIQAVAPGIAEALVATAAGIGAAVPAVLAYNHYVQLIRSMSADMESFSLRLLNLIEHESESASRR